MKYLNIFILIFICSILTTSLFAQDDEPAGNIMVVTTAQLAFPEDGSNAEFDSLNQLLTDNVRMKNEYILMHRNATHLWGNDSRDYITMFSVKTFEDVDKARKRGIELFMEAWPTEEARKAFNDAFGKYFTGVHSDEIYQELKTGRK